MKLAASVLICSLLASSGCYFGRTKSAKKGGYVASSMALVVGSAVIVSGTSGNNCPDGSDVSCGVGAGAGAAGAALVGVALIAAGGLGLLLNVVVPTRSDTPPVVVPSPGSATVTTPGLPATQIELR